MDQYDVDFVELADGKRPFEEFLDSLNEEVQAEIIATIDDFIDRKNRSLRISEKLSKPLRDGIFELRTTFADGIARTLFFYMKGKRVIITHGFVKKTQKTPPREIEKAIKLRSAYVAKDKE